MAKVKTFILTFFTCTLFIFSGSSATYDKTLSFITLIVAAVVLFFLTKHFFEMGFETGLKIGLDTGFIIGMHTDRDGENNGN